jgi:hypothetical protein
MGGGQEGAHSVIHLSELFVLADGAGLLHEPDVATERLRRSPLQGWRKVRSQEGRQDGLAVVGTAPGQRGQPDACNLSCELRERCYKTE